MLKMSGWESASKSESKSNSKGGGFGFNKVTGTLVFGAGIVAGAIVAGASYWVVRKHFWNKPGGDSENEQIASLSQLPESPSNASIPCIICRTETSRNDRTVFRCNHIAHFECYYALRQNGGTFCPIPSCRTSFVE